MTPDSAPAVAGVDGFRGGWVVARVEHRAVTWTACPDAAAVLGATQDCAAVGVDIPLGMPAAGGRRRSEDAVARALGRARSSVFLTPSREVLRAGTYEQACAVARRSTGRAISLQTFHIGPKVLDWDAVAELPAHVVEVHPELALRTLAPDVAFTTKRSARGAGQRIAALGRWLDVADALGDLPAGPQLDDALDALAAAWSADRFARGVALVFDDEPDDRGRPMRIVV